MKVSLPTAEAGRSLGALSPKLPASKARAASPVLVAGPSLDTAGTGQGQGWQAAIPAFDPAVCLPQEEGSVSTPDRLFKIVFVGNSSVGKTSFLSRFCDGKFSPGSTATMGEFSALGYTPAHLWEGAAVRRVPREGLGAP